MDVEVKILQATDLDQFNQLLDVFDIVFEYEASPRPDDAYLGRLLNKDSFMVIVAMQAGTVIAGLTAYVLDQYHSTLPVLFVQDLAVMHDFQRKGVGRKLIDYVVRYARDQGFQQMYIQAELADDYAVEFYRKTKPTGELMAVHFYYDVGK